LQPEVRRPSATDLLSFELLSPNEEDDFLEVRFHLETVAEQAIGLEDDEDNSDEEPASSASLGSHHQRFVDRSESKSVPRLHTEYPSESQSLDKPELLRAKTLSHLDQQSHHRQDLTLVAPMSDPQRRETFSQVKSSSATPEKSPKDATKDIPPHSPQQLVQTSSQYHTGMPSDGPSGLSPVPTVLRRLSGGNELRKTSSRVVRVCLPEGGPRGRSSSFIDVPLSPVSHEIPSNQLSLLPHPSPMSHLHSTSSYPIQHHQINLHETFSGDADSFTITSSSSHTALSKSPPEENFLGVVDVGDKGSDNNGDTKSENCLIFRLRVPFESTFKEIEFEFDLLRDQPQSIVDEMNEVDELIFLSPYAKQIVDSLTPIVNIAQRVLREKEKAASWGGGGGVGGRDESCHKHRTALSNLVLEKLLATPGEFDDRALAAWSNAAEERRSKENEETVSSCQDMTQRPHHPIQVNLAAAAGAGGVGEVSRSPPSTEREDLSRGGASESLPEDQPPKAVRTSSKNISQGVGDVSTPSTSHVRVTSPTKTSPDDSRQTMSMGLLLTTLP
jgi:hypothetical protein